MNNNINVPVNPTYHEVVNDFAKEWEKNKSERYKEYRRKWSENPKNFIVEGAPLHLDIEPTNACNLKCPMCPRTVIVNDGIRSKNFKIGNMSLDTYKKIIDEASSIGVYSIKLNILGEPLVHPDIVEMVKYAKDKGIIDVMLNTNAALLTKDLSTKLIKAGLDKIFFSFDSPFKEKYEKIRIGANYEQTLKNIKDFVNIRNKFGKKTTLTRVSMVLMDDNRAEYNEFVKLFKDIVDIVAYVECMNPSREERSKININNHFCCSQLWQRMFITWDGCVLPCCGDKEKEYVLGNIHKESIKNIWNNKKYIQIRNNHKVSKWYKHSICKKCDLTNRKNDGSI